MPELIDVLVAEDETDEAWEVAVEHADLVHESRWLQLISVREHTHPSDVIAPYHRLIEQRLGMINDKYRYNKAIKLIRSLRYAYSATNQHAELAEYVADLRDRHKRKTAFMAKLDKAGL